MNQDRIPSKFRKLYLVNVDGSQIGLNGRLIEKDGSIDLSGLLNANAAAPVVLVIAEMCNFNGWHEIGRVPLPCWSSDA